jgi:hypothetical protein
MGRLLALLAFIAGVTLSMRAAALEQDFDLSLDFRVVAASGQNSWLNDGGGKLRFDENHQGLRLGSLRLGYRASLTSTLHLTAEAVSYGDHDKNALDLTELAVSWRPVPTSTLRSEFKLGAFYPPISLEHRMRGWRTPYSLSASAINTWVGEELRTIGLEYNADWLRQANGNSWNFGLTGAVFGWNDPAGVVVALRGWSLHDRQTTLFGRVGQRDQGVTGGRTLFYDEIDGRAGYYAAASANYRGLVEFRALRYDNRADPSKMAPAIDDGAWLTKFNSGGIRVTPNDQWTFMWQRLQGRTYIGTAPPNTWLFDADYLLASWKYHAQRISLRYDRFWMKQTVTNFGFYNHDYGHAFTAAWLYEFNRHVTVVAESLEIDSDLGSRLWVGAPQDARERQLQLALRLEF